MIFNIGGVLKMVFTLSVVALLTYLIYDYKKSKDMVNHYKELTDGLINDISLLEDSIKKGELIMDNIIVNRDDIIKSLKDLRVKQDEINEKIESNKVYIQNQDLKSLSDIESTAVVNKTINDIFEVMFYE